MKNAFWVVLLCALAFISGGLTLSQFDTVRKFSNPTSVSEAPASAPVSIPSRATPRMQHVGALGRIEPQSEVLDIGAAIGDRVLRLLVVEGQQVTAGQTLAYLESHNVQLAEKNGIAAQLEEAWSYFTTTAALGKARIRKAKVDLAMVETLEPVRIEAQEARIRGIEAELANAESEFKRAAGLRSKGMVNKEAFERKRLTVQSLKESLTSTKLILAEMKANHKLVRQSARAALQVTKADLEVSLVAIAVKSLARKLLLAEAQLQRTIIQAPISGQILNIFTWPGERIGNAPILQMGNTEEMHVVAEVYETDVQHIRIGQRATIQSPALLQPVTGTVLQIGVMIHKNDVLDVDPAADVDARVVEVRIRLDNLEMVRQFTNLQVDVLIDLDSEPESMTGNPRGSTYR